MIKCSKCNSIPSDNDVIGWKCNSCGKVFQVTNSQVHSILMKKKYIMFCIALMGSILASCASNDNFINGEQNSVEVTEAPTAIPTVTNTPSPTPIEVPKSYETMYDLKEAVVNYIDKNYSDGSVLYYVDEYTDNTIIDFPNAGNTISNKQKGYGVGLSSQIVAWDNTEKVLDFSYLYKIMYASNSFLDYMYDCNCIFLANDGTRYSFPIQSIKQYEEDNLYFTEMSITFNKADYENLKLLYELSQKEGLSFQMDKTNNDDEYVNITLDDVTIKNMRNTIEVYIDLYDELYNESE